MKLSTQLWSGASGVPYFWHIHPLQPHWPFGPANYIFARQTSCEMWDPILIGQTSDLTRTMSCPAITDRVLAAGATHVHIYVKQVPLEIARDVICADLLRKHHPVLNSKLESGFRPSLN